MRGRGGETSLRLVLVGDEMHMLKLPSCYRTFTGSFFDGSFDHFGIEGTAEWAARGHTTEEKKELIEFFRNARINKLPPQKLGELWFKGESPYIMSPETIGSFFDMIIEKLEAALAAERDAGRGGR